MATPYYMGGLLDEDEEISYFTGAAPMATSSFRAPPMLASHDIRETEWYRPGSDERWARMGEWGSADLLDIDPRTGVDILYPKGTEPELKRSLLEGPMPVIEPTLDLETPEIKRPKYDPFKDPAVLEMLGEEPMYDTSYTPPKFYSPFKGDVPPPEPYEKTSYEEKYGKWEPGEVFYPFGKEISTGKREGLTYGVYRPEEGFERTYEYYDGYGRPSVIDSSGYATNPGLASAIYEYDKLKHARSEGRLAAKRDAEIAKYWDKIDAYTDTVRDYIKSSGITEEEYSKQGTAASPLKSEYVSDHPDYEKLVREAVPTLDERLDVPDVRTYTPDTGEAVSSSLLDAVISPAAAAGDVDDASPSLVDSIMGLIDARGSGGPPPRPFIGGGVGPHSTLTDVALAGLAVPVIKPLASIGKDIYRGIKGAAAARETFKKAVAEGLEPRGGFAPAGTSAAASFAPSKISKAKTDFDMAVALGTKVIKPSAASIAETKRVLKSLGMTRDAMVKALRRAGEKLDPEEYVHQHITKTLGTPGISGTDALVGKAIYEAAKPARKGLAGSAEEAAGIIDKIRKAIKLPVSEPGPISVGVPAGAVLIKKALLGEEADASTYVDPYPGMIDPTFEEAPLTTFRDPLKHYDTEAVAGSLPFDMSDSPFYYDVMETAHASEFAPTPYPYVPAMPSPSDYSYPGFTPSSPFGTAPYSPPGYSPITGTFAASPTYAEIIAAGGGEFPPPMEIGTYIAE